MDVAALQVGDLLHGLGGVFIFGDRAGQGDQNLVGVQARVPAAEVVRLERLDRFDGALLSILWNALWVMLYFNVLRKAPLDDGRGDNEPGGSAD